MAGKKLSSSETLYELATVPPQLIAAAEVYSYEPKSGVFTVKADAPNVKGCRRGKTARGSLDGDGYRRFSVSRDGIRTVVSAQRLAWYLMTGEYPATALDHRNGDRDDNRWENLRVATYQQNAFNSCGNAGKVLPKGVYVSTEGQTWRARIKVNGKNVDLGTYTSVAEASAAYQGAAHVIQGEYRRAA